MNEDTLRQDLVELLNGGHAHSGPKAVLARMPRELRATRPEGLHSVWEELEHMRLAQEDILRYTLDASWVSPDFPSGYWPEPSEVPDDAAWERSVARFLSELEEVAALASGASRDLTARIPHGEGRTYLRQVLLVADHNAYHLGQVVAVRKLLKCWSPS